MGHCSFSLQDMAYGFCGSDDQRFDGLVYLKLQPQECGESLGIPAFSAKLCSAELEEVRHQSVVECWG